MSVTDFKAAQKWSKLPQTLKHRLLGNVFCSNCGATTVVDYTLHDNVSGILIKGKCNKCGKDVARLVEDE